MIIGAGSADPNGVTDAGAAYLYSGATGNLLDRVVGTAVNSSFGAAVSIMPDSTGNGKGNSLCGASRNSPGGLSEAGSCLVLGFNSFLTPSSYSVSGSAGGTLDWELDFPSSANGHEYRLVISGSGMGPTTYGIEIPLSLDQLATQTYSGNYPFPNAVGLQGTLDSNGDGSCSFDTPAGLSANLIGRTFWIAVIANPVGQIPTHSSIAIPISIGL